MTNTIDMTQTATPIENFNVKLIYHVEGLGLQVLDTTMENIEAAFSVRGFELIGFNDTPRQRAELQGCPVFSKLCGPMWGGENTIRYEDRTANDIISN